MLKSDSTVFRETELVVDVRDDFIAKALFQGRSFIDVGGLWGTVSEKLSVAARAGATKVAMMDILPLNHPLWGDLRTRLSDLGVSEFDEVSANLDAIEPEMEGFDVVHCSGVVYHVPSPLHTIRKLYQLSRRHLVLTSMVVPNQIDTSEGSLHLRAGQSLLVPALDAGSLRILDSYWDAMGVRNAGGIDVPAKYDMADYGPWWWLPTPGALESWVRLAGFEIEGSEPFWGGRSHTVLARRSV